MTHSPYRIRYIDLADCEEEIVAIHGECFEGVKEEYAPEGGDWWGAFYEDVLIGFAHLRPSVQWLQTGYMARAAVTAPHRGNRLQRRLVQAREAQARRYGWEWMLVETLDNPQSANTLIRCGYRMFHPRDPWGAPEATYWRKYLGGAVKSLQPH